MRVFETIKAAVPLRQAAEHYGLRVLSNGMTCCPFHKDRHPSMKLNEDYFFCFGCGASGDVIDFTAKLYGLSLYDAAKKLAYDFGITQDKPPDKVMQEKQNRKSEAQRLRENEKLCFSALLEYMKLLQEWKRLYAPRTPEEEWHPHFIEACDRLDYVEYLVDTLIGGDSYERNEVIELLMTDSKLKKLQRYLEKVKKEEKHIGEQQL